MESPSTNGSKRTRAPNGRFLVGNPGGPGNPFAGKVAKLREAGWKSVKPAEVRKVYRKLLDLALSGDVPAARLLLDRLLGPVEAVDVLTELAEIRKVVDSLLNERQTRCGMN
jgi:hypothetical protein